MRPFAFLSLGLLSCSDYDLSGKADEQGRVPRDDTDDVVVDTDDTDDSGGPSDTDDDVPPDDTDDTGEEHPDGKIDVVLIIDVAYSYDCYRADVAVESAALINALLDSGADVAIALATYDDYNVDGEWWVAYGGVPYALEQQLTTDRSRLLSAAGGISLEWGGDGPGTGYEALLQATTGRGYDQDCDTNYDSANDIKPFKSGGSDAFGGAVNDLSDSTVPGTGTISGVGFRESSKRVVAIFAENAMRDRGEGDEIPQGTCLGVAGRSDAVDAIKDADAKFLGVNAYEFWDIDTTPQEQLEDIATRTNSKIDSDGDGARDDVAVFGGDWNWPETAVLVSAIWDLAR